MNNMSSHDLNIERLRHAKAKVPRHKRLCSCCDQGAREDEMHLLECPAYAEVVTCIRNNNNDNNIYYMYKEDGKTGT